MIKLMNILNEKRNNCIIECLIAFFLLSLRLILSSNLFMGIFLLYSIWVIYKNNYANATYFYIFILLANNICYFNYSTLNVSFIIHFSYLFAFLFKRYFYGDKYILYLPFLLFFAYVIIFFDYSRIQDSFGYLVLLITYLNFYIILVHLKRLEGKICLNIYFISYLVFSILSSFRGYIPTLDSLLTDAYIGEAFRFTGLEFDTNYYGLLSCVIFMLSTRYFFRYRSVKAQAVFYLCISLISLTLGVITLSKTFLLVIVLYGLIEFIFSKISVSKKLIVLFFLSLLTVLMIFILPDTTDIKILLNRFSHFSNLNEYTSGRVALWNSYIKAILTSPKTFLFGQGMNALGVHGRAAHNVILELVWLYGIGGISIIIFNIIHIIKVNHININKISLLDKLNLTIPMIIFFVYINSLSPLTNTTAMLSGVIIFIFIVSYRRNINVN